MKRVLITGADRGIGLALCRCFLEHGWQVFAGRYMEDWTELDSLKNEYGRQLCLVRLDVGDEESVRQAARQVAEETGRTEPGRGAGLDMLVNCAGIFQNSGREAVYRCLDINTIGPLRVTEAFLPLMENGEKRICFFSSEAGSITLAHRTGDIPYCVSKTCLNMEVRLLFEKLRPLGWRFRLYHPGWVRSYMSGVKSTEGNYEPEEAAAAAYEQFVSDQDWEDVLVMRDIAGEWWPF